MHNVRPLFLIKVFFCILSGYFQTRNIVIYTLLFYALANKQGVSENVRTRLTAWYIS